ncbi:DNA-binding protein YbaB [Nonomuraea polychroma]|uniref:DNA-binding protein YbaB n=1 Tax=Nonomuraea polychroma TaxID=46176 RepID=A0A438MBG5_9ACTN|nr:YbaB/EbfC family nucleoid-associated protein [Nonomuraea polychroma]RVX43062.1 DNA-binding protein YbaB [Nonomuraea polychroma]
MTTPSPEADAEHMERVLSQGARMMARLRQAQAELRDVSGRAESSDGMVRAVADGRGGIVELRLDPRVMRLDHAALGKQVTAVLQDAQREAETRVRRITDDAMADTEHMPQPLDETFIRDRVEQVARNLIS